MPESNRSGPTSASMAGTPNRFGPVMRDYFDNSYPCREGIESFLDQCGGGALTARTCGYRTEYYSDELFEPCGIEFPRNLRNAAIKRRSVFFAGRYCAYLALEALRFREMNVRVGKHRAPIWLGNIVGSISHTELLAIAVLTESGDTAGLGVDIENVVGPDVDASTRALISAKEEIEILDTCGVSNDMAFTTIFSAKESFFKAAFPIVNVYFDFWEMKLEEVRIGEKKLIFRLNKTLNAKLVEGLTYEANYCFVDDDTVLTLVTL